MNEAGFLEAIVAEPEDDTHRLVFADWLTDNGDPTWASFIRDQVALAKMDEADPAYPALLARTRRSGMLTEPRHRPMRDHVPDGRVMFRRGLIAGVEIDPRKYVALPNDAWDRVAVQQLRLSAGAWELLRKIDPELSKRPELARVRTLVIGDCRVVDAEAMLDSPHLTRLRALRLVRLLESRNGPEPVLRDLPLPGLDSFAVRLNYSRRDLASELPRGIGPLRRLDVRHDVLSSDAMAYESQAFRELVQSQHWATLSSANVLALVFDARDHTEEIVPADPGDVAPHLASSRLRTLHTHGVNLEDNPLLSVGSWGPVEDLHIHVQIEAWDLAAMLAWPPAKLLRSLTLAITGKPPPGFEELEAAPALPNLRQLSGLECTTPLIWPHRSSLLRLAARPDFLHDPRLRSEGIEFPGLHWLNLALSRSPEADLQALIANRATPNLCTLVLSGIEERPARMLEALARAPHLPHLSLVGICSGYWTEWWVLGQGQVTKVRPEVLPLDEDWWEPDPLADWFYSADEDDR
jgi:uncharacterized protein (TIGR02996 family)